MRDVMVIVAYHLDAPPITPLHHGTRLKRDRQEKRFDWVANVQHSKHLRGTREEEFTPLPAAILYSTVVARSVLI